MGPSRMVYVVDDDATVRASVCALANSMGCRAESFGSAAEFLAAATPTMRGVVVVDLRMPDLSGLELQAELARRSPHLPLILLTAYARTPTTVRAIQAGAVAVIDKPYYDNDLWDAIRQAFEREETDWLASQQRNDIRSRVATLTAEERRVAELMIKGLPNKTIAHDLGIAIRTVEKRRHDVFAKMKAQSVVELKDLFHVLGDPP